MRYFYFILIFLFSFNANSAYNIECNNLIKKLKSTNDRKVFYVPLEEYNHFGFDLQYKIKNDDWVLDRDSENYPKVGRLTYLTKIENIFTNDILISIDNFELKDLKEDEIRDLLYENDSDEILLKTKRGKKIFEQKLVKQKFDAEEPDLEFAVSSINSISQINSLFNADIYLLTYVDYELETEGLPFANLAFENFVYLDEKGDYKFSYCEEVPINSIDGKFLPNPGEYINLRNSTKEDRDLIKETISIYPFSPKIGDDESLGEGVRVQYLLGGNFDFRNNYNLQNFPFDKQILKFQLTNLKGMGTGNIDFDSYTINNLENLEFDLSGWKYLGFEAENKVFKDISGTFDLSGIEISIMLEREPGYYVFKVILPILLILIVCWSVTWISAEELESKLTITIVCLLSLIAYNFVIDSELPKLDYLTILDWIILVSYVYATIPNFLSIITFRLHKAGNVNLIDVIDKKSKLYGLPSYIILILLIIFLNVNINPDNTSAVFSWMAAR